ncbi:hypothetical protein ACSX1A_11945 [Pontibacter sp. MBLB2868]|uniref:hypothetical protein n=1 Tax=Pontibacter sp. MBLB2868 TaxID=3451555 RepID=UPI003F7518D3
MKERQAKLTLFVHLLTVFVLLLKGIDKTTQHHPVSGIILILLSLIILALVVFERKLGLTHSTVKLTCYFIEALALTIVAVVLHQEGKQYVQYLFGGSAVAYLISAFVYYYKHKQASH